MDDAHLIDQITAALTEAFQLHGHYRHTYTSDRERDILTRAGHQAAAQLDRPLETVDRDGALHLIITDRGEGHPLEAQLDDTHTRNAIHHAFTDPTT